MNIHDILIISFPTSKAAFSLKMQTIKGNVTGNTNFTSAEVTAKLALFATAADAYDAALLLGPGHTNAREQARTAAALAAQNLAYALETEANGDRAMLETTGYDLAKTGPVSSVGVPDVPTNCQLINGPGQGDVVGKCKKSLNTMWCDMRLTLTPDVAGSWKEHTGFTDSRKMVVDGFQKKDEVFAQFRCCNGHGKSDWSQTVSVIIGAH